MAQQFAVEGPLDVAVKIGAGRVEVSRAEPGTSTAAVLPLDPDHAPSVRLAANAEIGLHRNTLVVTVPDSGRSFRKGEVVVRLTLPEASQLTVKAGSAVVSVRDGLDELDAKLGAGQVDADTVTGAVAVKAGQVEVTVGSAGSVAVATGQGSLRAGIVGDALFKAGQGDVHLGRTDGEVQVKGGAVGLVVSDAGPGEVSFTTAAGDARVAVRPETTVQLDLTSVAGDVRCDLPMESGAPTGGPELRIRLRTGSGDLLVTSAAVAPAADATG